MRAVSQAVVFLGALTLTIGSQAAAQNPQTRQGFWIGFGFGYGSAKPSCDGCSSSSSEGGVTGFLKLGGTLNKQVLLGGEVNAWTKSESGTTDALGNASFAVYYYPVATSGFFVKGGVGGSSFRESNGATSDGAGLGFLTGLGYDIRVGRNISITPVGNLYYGFVGDITESSTPVATGWKQYVFDFALGVTFH